MKVSQAVSQMIRQILAEKKMTQYRLKLNLGLSKGTLVSLMYARYKGVNLTTLIVVIWTLGVYVEEFFANPLFDEENLEIE